MYNFLKIDMQALESLESERERMAIFTLFL